MSYWHKAQWFCSKHIFSLHMWRHFFIEHFRIYHFASKSPLRHSTDSKNRVYGYSLSSSQIASFSIQFIRKRSRGKKTLLKLFNWYHIITWTAYEWQRPNRKDFNLWHQSHLIVSLDIDWLLSAPSSIINGPARFCFASPLFHGHSKCRAKKQATAGVIVFRSAAFFDEKLWLKILSWLKEFSCSLRYFLPFFDFI